MDDQVVEQPSPGIAERARAAGDRGRAAIAAWWRRSADRRRRLRSERREWRRDDRELRLSGERERIDHLDLRPLAKVALCYFSCIYLLLVVASIVFWLMLEGFGIVDNFERFMGEVGFRDFELEPVRMLGGVALIGLVLMVMMVLLTVLAGAFYNGLADRWGGLTVRLSAPAARPTRRTLPTTEWDPGDAADAHHNGNGSANGNGVSRNGHAVPVGTNGARERAPQGFD